MDTVQQKVKASLNPEINCWCAAINNDYSNPANWTAGTVPNATFDRAYFPKDTGTIGNVILTMNATLSSMIFDGSTGTGYTITPSENQSFTLQSSIAAHAQIMVMGGNHVVEPNLQMAAGSLMVNLASGSSLTLAGVLSNQISGQAAGLTFNGLINGYGNRGTLILSGANTYTGSTLVTNGVLELTSLGDHASPNPLGQSSADPANFVLSDGILHCTGGGATDRGFTVQGNCLLQCDHDASFSGQIIGTSGNTLCLKGDGTITLNNYGQIEKAAPGQLLFGDFYGTCTATITDYAIVHCGGDVYIGRGNSGTTVGHGNVALAGCSQLNAGKLIVGDMGSDGTLNVGGNAMVTVAGDILLGQQWGDLPELLGPGGIVHVSGTTVAGGSIIIGANGGIGIYNQNGGQSTSTAVAILGQYDYWDAPNVEWQTPGDGTLNLNGGTFACPGITTDGDPNSGGIGGTKGVVNFRGGVLKATAANSNFLRTDTGPNPGTLTLNVQTGGAIIDTNGFNITITKPLLEDPSMPGGGLTKLGPGRLAIAAASSYAGDTVIAAGTLQVGISGAIPSGVGKGNIVFSAADNLAVFNLNGFDATVNAINQPTSSSTNYIVNNAVGTIARLTIGDNDASGIYAGVIADNTGTGGTLALMKIGNGSITLSGTLSYTGDTNVVHGVLNVGSLTTSPNITVSNDATLIAGSVVCSQLTIGGGIQAVPEPSGLALFGMAALGLLLYAWRRKTIF